MAIGDMFLISDEVDLRRWCEAKDADVPSVTGYPIVIVEIANYSEETEAHVFDAVVIETMAEGLKRGRDRSRILYLNGNFSGKLLKFEDDEIVEGG